MKELANLRKARRLSQSQLAEMAGVDQATISKIERGTGYNFTSDMLGKLADALKVTQAELLGVSDLQRRVLEAIYAIKDPARQAAALVVLESMASRGDHT